VAEQFGASVAYSEMSTTASSPAVYRSSDFSVQRLDPIVEIRPVLEDMFKSSGTGRRVLLAKDDPGMHTTTGTCAVVALAPPLRVTKKKGDESIQRLAKIAKYKL
jgi:hypothetical protein